MKVEVFATKRAGGRVEVQIPPDFKGKLSDEQEPGESLFIYTTPRDVTLDEWNFIKEWQKEGETLVSSTGRVLVEDDPLLRLPREIALKVARAMGFTGKTLSLPLNSLVPLLREHGYEGHLSE